jgi:hypothetical protein
MVDAVLGFTISDGNFESFRQVASYRQASRLDILPGFPDDPGRAHAVEALEADAGTRAQLARSNLTGRDYVLTGWAMILAHDPEQWGVTGERLTADMRRNIAFVRAHREGVEAFLR